MTLPRLPDPDRRGLRSGTATYPVSAEAIPDFALEAGSYTVRYASEAADLERLAQAGGAAQSQQRARLFVGPVAKRHNRHIPDRRQLLGLLDERPAADMG